MPQKNKKGAGNVKNYILIGFMGSGKSTVGVRLSYKLKMPYIDTDRFIEKREGRKIQQIFSEDGESEFRMIETECIRDIAATRKGYVISTGGGTPLRAENRELLRRMGYIVYLRCRPETVYRRIGDDSSRPLLQTVDPMESIRSLMAERESIYMKIADIVIDTDDMLTDEIAEEIIEDGNHARGGGKR
jgi:shikimate kinase